LILSALELVALGEVERFITLAFGFDDLVVRVEFNGRKRCEKASTTASSMGSAGIYWHTGTPYCCRR
jgi:hypothetical protein